MPSEEISLNPGGEGIVGQTPDQTGIRSVDAGASEAWLTCGRFSLFIAFVIAALYPHVLFGSEAWFYRDYGAFGYPLAKYHRDCFWSGEIPVWNQFSACGLPYLAQWNTMTLYPLSLIYLLLPLPWSLPVFCLFHLFLAAVGMYLLASFWTKNSLAAAVAGAAFAFNGLTLHNLMCPNNIAGLAWMPWVVLTAQRGWQNGGRALLLAALTGAVQMLSGAPEVILFTWLIVSVLLLIRLFSVEAGRCAVVWRSALIVALIVGLAAAQLFPFLDLLRHSDRDSNFGAASWAMPAWGWVNLLLPLFQSSLAPPGVYFQSEQWWTSSYYPGVGIVFLALLALRLAPQKQVWTLLGVAAFALIMSFGEKAYLYTAIHKAFPFLGFMRFPIKFVVLPIFILPLLAAYAVAGFSSATATASEKSTTVERWAKIIPGVIAAVIAGALLYSYWHPYYHLEWSDLLQNGILRIVFLALIAGILVILRSNPRRQFLLQATVVLCVVLDVWTHMPNQNPTINPELYEPGFIARQLDPKCASGEARAMLSKPTHDFLYQRMLVDHDQDFLGRRAGMFGNCNLLDRVPIVDAFYSLYLFEQRQIFFRLFHAAPTNFPAGLADFVGVRQVCTNLFEWQTRPSAQPLITAGARPVFLERSQILNRLLEPAFDPRQVVYLPLEAKASIAVTNGSVARISNRVYRSGHISADVETAEPALFVVAETLYHGWKAFVDGKPARIWRANHAFQAVEVPAGRRHVELIYQDKSFFAGGILSGSTLLGCLVAWFRTGKRKLCQSSESSASI